MSEQKKSSRLVWLDGLRFVAAVGILLYHAQMLFSHFAFSPTQAGLSDNLQRLFSATSALSGSSELIASFVGVQWFGWVFLGVFMWLTGFGLTLSVSNETMLQDEGLLLFWKKRLTRLLEPFWVTVVVSVPILVLVGLLTNSYIPSAWSFGASLLFPVTYEYGGATMLAVSGPWWYVPLAVSFTLVFPWLLSKLRVWGVSRFLWILFSITVLYRVMAVYVFDGHPTYLIAPASAGAAPFELLFAHLFTLALGMASAVWYREKKGPWAWKTSVVFVVGLFGLILGLLASTVRIGWIFTDILIPPALVLLSALVLRPFERFKIGTISMRWLGSMSYVFFLVHNFFVDRIINLWVRGDIQRYWMSLPVMIVGSLLSAWLIDVLIKKMIPIMKAWLMRLSFLSVFIPMRPINEK